MTQAANRDPRSAIPHSAIDRLHRLAEAAAPNECCGALLGSTDFSNSWQVEEVRPIENSAADPTRAYLIPSATVRELERSAFTAGLDLIGFFHSHPTSPARPSATDFQLAWPGYLYLIVALGEVTAWRLDAERGRFDEIPLVSP